MADTPEHTAETYAAFLLTLTPRMIRVERALGTEDEEFRQMALEALNDPPRLDVRSVLPDDVLTVEAIGDAFYRLAASYAEGSTRACGLIAIAAIEVLLENGGEEAIEAFLSKVEASAHEE